MKKDSYYYEKLATTLILENKVYKGMSEEDIITQICSQAKKDLGRKEARYYINGEDFLSDAVSEIYKKLK